MFQLKTPTFSGAKLLEKHPQVGEKHPGFVPQMLLGNAAMVVQYQLEKHA